MKRCIFLCILCLSAARSGFAQASVYHPFPGSDAYWCEWHAWGRCPYSDSYTLFIKGDTIIGGQLYLKVYESGSYACSYFPPRIVVDQYRIAFRQDTTQRKIFFVPKGDMKEECLYDFNLSIGDTVKGACGYGQKITSIDSVFFQKSWRKIYTVSGFPDLSLIEGIGSTYGFFSCSGVENHYRLESFTHGGESLVYQPYIQGACSPIGIEDPAKELLIQITPNPSTGRFQVVLPNNKKGFSIEVFNPLGKLMMTKEIISECEVDLSFHSKGIYLLKIYSANSIATKKLIVH